MFEKVTKFRMLPSRRPASELIVPANDNRRLALRGAGRRARAPRLICRWELDASTNRPACRWELDSADEPNPSLQRTPLLDRTFHKTVFRLSYLNECVEAAGAANFTSDLNAPPRKTRAHSSSRRVLHARH